MPKVKLHDLVVVLPGITGSVLSKRGRDVWAVSGGALWSALTSLGDSVQELKLPRHDPCGDPPHTELTATGLINDFHGVFGLWRIDGYDATVQAIVAGFDVQAGAPDDPNEHANLIAFPYDWRLSNRVAARALQALVNRRLPAYRKAKSNPGAKVILLAHSMGGLAARYYLEKLGGWRDCRALITFGTPFRGAVEALNYLANGYRKAVLGKTLVDLTEVMRSLPAVYELLPRYPALKVGDTWQRPAEAGALPGVDAGYASAALKFHHEIDAAIDANRNDPDYQRDPYLIFPVVGVRQPTLNSAFLEAGRVVASEHRPDWLDAELAGGDGTVPRVSATPHDREKEFREIFFAERHASLQRNDYVLTDLVERLKQLQAPRKAAALGGVALAPRRLSLALDELYLPGEPVELRVEAEGIEAYGPPRAVVAARAPGAATQAMAFKSDGERWVANLGALPAGQYHVRVETTQGGPGAPTPVHDVFEVAG